MTIAYVPNDPMSATPSREIEPTPDRAAPLVGFSVRNLPAAKVYPPASRDYVAWSAREAALRAVNAFEACAGPLKGWQGTPPRQSLPLDPDAGTDLNAYYDRSSVSFFESAVGGKPFFSGASQDVVAHEVGHAILDALRPDLWDVAMIEVSAFHEGFGDCIAVLTALADKGNREALLKADPKLAKANGIEALVEALAGAIGVAIDPGHNAAVPRHALSDFRWQLPTTLPNDGPGTVLINEMHSLGQLVCGTYYRTILGVFARTSGNEAGLWQAVRVATWLLAGAVRRAPVRPRFLQSVGRTMLAVDQTDYRGANTPAIRAAYRHHGIDVSATTLLAPQQALGPMASGFAAAGDTPLGSAGTRDLSELLDAQSGAKPSFRRVEFGTRAVAVASVDRAVDISGLDPRLAGAVAVAPQEAFVGEAGGGAALLGAVDTGASVATEVRSFVEMLLRRDDIAFDAAPKPKPRARRPRGSGVVSTPGSKTHAVTASGRTAPRLRRIAFACRCHH